MDPFSALGACSSILQIIDFSCKLLSKGNQLRTSFSGALPENIQFEKVTSHLHGLVATLRQHSATQNQGLDGLVVMCVQTAGELLDVLERLKVQGSRTRWKSFRAAVKSVWRKEKVEEMLGRLGMIRDEIEFGFIVDLREELVRLAAQQSTRFDALDQSTKAVLQAILNGQSASTAASNVQTHAIEDMNAKLESLIINEHQQTRNEIIDEIRQQNLQHSTRGGFVPLMPQIDPNLDPFEKTDILVMLKFVTIDDRHSSIPAAHRTTFGWIWASQTQGYQIWSNFWQWLTEEQGIYWVSGKAGSGKSTLMKYIYHDERTKQGLQHWSAHTDVVTAGFFFWNSGSAMQKSLLGLLQSILYEILQQKPNLKEAVFPTKIQDEVSKRWLSRAPDSDTIWTVADLKPAFDRLLRIPSLKICLFIDGLDEYEGDHEDIANLFQRIMTSPSVKACLSSRPLVAFERSFLVCPRLRLQDLTYNDISLYVREKLEGREEVSRMSLAEPSEFHQLVEEIIAKASGVFLWVTLAVRSLLEGLTNFDRMADLQFRLKEIPDDLSQLYWHMLRSIKPSFYLGQAAKLLRIMHTVYSHSWTMTVEHLAFAEEYEVGQPITHVSISSYEDYASKQAGMMEGRLMSRCRGLLEARGGIVAFLHQSVPDFLVQPDVKKSLDEKIQKRFSPYACILAAILREISHNGGEMEHFSDSGQRRMTHVLYLARRADEELGSEGTSLMDEVNKVFSKALNKHTHEGNTSWKFWSFSYSGLSWAGFAAHNAGPRPYAWNDTFLSLCLQKGLVNYICAKLDSGAPMHQGTRQRPLLDFVIDFRCIRHWIDFSGTPRKLVDLCCLLLERGADPNEEFEGQTAWEKVLYLADGGYPYQDATLIDVYARWNDDLNEDEYNYPNFANHWIWIEIMNVFLDYGADPSAGLIESQSYGKVHIKPAALFVEEKLIPEHRQRAIELYKKMVSRGGTTVPYSRPARPSYEPLLWELLPKPHPQDIPGAAPPDRHTLNDFTPKGRQHMKLNVKTRHPDYEGMIPVSMEPYSYTTSLPIISPTPIQPAHTPKKSIYSRIKNYVHSNQDSAQGQQSITIQPQMQAPAPQIQPPTTPSNQNATAYVPMPHLQPQYYPPPPVPTLSDPYPSTPVYQQQQPPPPLAPLMSSTYSNSPYTSQHPSPRPPSQPVYTSPIPVQQYQSPQPSYLPQPTYASPMPVQQYPTPQLVYAPSNLAPTYPTETHQHPTPTQYYAPPQQTMYGTQTHLTPNYAPPPQQYAPPYVNPSLVPQYQSTNGVGNYPPSSTPAFMPNTVYTSPQGTYQPR